MKRKSSFSGSTEEQTLSQKCSKRLCTPKDKSITPFLSGIPNELIQNQTINWQFDKDNTITLLLRKEDSNQFDGLEEKDVFSNQHEKNQSCEKDKKEEQQKEQEEKQNLKEEQQNGQEEQSNGKDEQTETQEAKKEQRQEEQIQQDEQDFYKKQQQDDAENEKINFRIIDQYY